MNDKELGNLIRSCIKKRRYSNEQSALEAINRARKNKSKDPLRIYFCKHCLGYHLTHKVNFKKEKVKA